MKHSNLALVDGEVYVLSERYTKVSLNDFVYDSFQVYQWKDNKSLLGSVKVLASTSNLDGIPKLERKWFVKPVDIQKKATEIFESSHLCLSTDFITGYRMGYTDNKAEFTRDDMYKMYIYMRTDNYGSFEEYMKEIRPLSLPQSITLNDDNEIISVEW